MFIVKLTYNYDWPVFRQTPNHAGVWGNYSFVIDDDLKECDFWVIYSNYQLVDQTVKCNPNHIIFIPAECYNTSPRFSQQFLDQFGLLLTVQRELKHRNILFLQNANPWFIGKSYDELVNLKRPEKTKLISVISSNKAFTKGHRERLEFVERLKKEFGDDLDVFGRGIRDFDDKWDVLADYKYSIAIENDNCEDWVTEKFYDCLYTFTHPIFYGCPNLSDYVDKKCFTRIDIHNFEESLAIIKQCIASNTYERTIDVLEKERLTALNKDNLFPLLVNVLETMDPKSEKEWVTIYADHEIDKPKSRSKRMKKTLKKFVNLITGKKVREPVPTPLVNYSIMEGTILSGENIIGAHTYIGFNCLITKSTIGRYCSIANNVSVGVGEHKINRVSTSSLFYKDPFKTLTEKECTVGNDVWIGSNSIIRRGVTIGDGAVIGANSFVNKDVEPFSIVAGNPAKFIKMRFSEAQIQQVSQSRYWEMDLEEAKIEIEKLELTGLFERND